MAELSDFLKLAYAAVATIVVWHRMMVWSGSGFLHGEHTGIAEVLGGVAAHISVCVRALTGKLRRVWHGWFMRTTLDCACVPVAGACTCTGSRCWRLGHA